MFFDKVVCLPDLLRTSQRRYTNGFFDLVREPIFQGTGLDIGQAPEMPQASNMLPGFDACRFRSLANVQVGHTEHAQQLAQSYYALSPAAQDYLFQHLPENALVLTLEIPPWMAEGCSSRSIPFISFAISPLRFGRDLYVAMRTSSQEIYRRLHAHAVPEEELRLEAAVLAANVRMHRLELEELRRYSFQNLDGGLIFLGQQPLDASLLAPNGIGLRFTDFAGEVRELSRGKRIFYKAHPYALEAAQEEMQALTEIVGSRPEPCLLNAYQILSSHDNLQLVGLSSGLLQEARYFGKKAHTLFRPFIALTDGAQPHADKYQQCHFHALLSPAFWYGVLEPQRPAPAIAQLPSISRNHARETLGLWWDYSKVMTWERILPYETVMRGGGAELRQRIEALERKAGQWTDTALVHGHDFSLHSGERQVAARYEDIRADHRYRYEWVHERLPDEGYGADVFCGNGYGTSLLSQSRHVLGIDGSTEAIRLAEQHYRTPRALFSQAYYPFSLPEQAFDFIVSLESVEHVEQGEAFLTMLVASLKPRGLLFFSVPCETHLPHGKFSDVFHFHYRHYRFEEVKGLIDAHGLELLEWAGQDVYSFTGQGQPTPLADPASMQLESSAVRQFIIFACRKPAVAQDVA